MIRVLHIMSSLSTMNGVMHVVMNYYRHINRSELQFDFLYFKDSEHDFKAEIEQLGGRVYKINFPTLSRTSLREKKHFFHEHAGDYVAMHCHSIFDAALFGRVARKSGIHHIIQHSHNTKFSDKKLSGIRNRLLLKYGERYITDYMACSRAALNIFSSKERRRKTSTILYNAIELKHFYFSPSARRAIRRQFHISQDDFVVGHVGRFAPQKNHQLLLEAFAKLQSQIPNAKLLLVGDGPLRAQIVQSIKELGLNDSAILAGPCQDASGFYSAFDTFVLTSVFEGLVVSGVEAQVNGLPTICSPGISNETKISKLFWKYPNNDPDDIATTILAKRGFRSKSFSGQDISPNYDIEKQSVRLEQFYLSLAKTEFRQ